MIHQKVDVTADVAEGGYIGVFYHPQAPPLKRKGVTNEVNPMVYNSLILPYYFPAVNKEAI